MNSFKSEGVIVNALPFRDYDCIVTLFTPDEGLIKLYCHHAYSAKKGKGAGITTPLTSVDVVYSKGRGDFCTCQEITVLSHHLALRQSLPVLNAACDMLEAVTTTQQPGKAAPELYQLLLAYLHKLPDAAVPASIACSFRLKLLRYEGLLGMVTHCCSCATALQEAWVYEQDAFCRSHAPSEALSLTAEERCAIELLAFSRDFAQIGALPVHSPLFIKVNTLFKSSFS